MSVEGRSVLEGQQTNWPRWRMQSAPSASLPLLVMRARIFIVPHSFFSEIRVPREFPLSSGLCHEVLIECSVWLLFIWIIFEPYRFSKSFLDAFRTPSALRARSRSQVMTHSPFSGENSRLASLSSKKCLCTSGKQNLSDSS